MVIASASPDTHSVALWRFAKNAPLVATALRTSEWIMRRALLWCDHRQVHVEYFANRCTAYR